MNDQPTALWVADAIEQIPAFIRVTSEEAAKELRRLHEVNEALLKACEATNWHSLDLPSFVVDELESALAKARGEI